MKLASESPKKLTVITHRGLLLQTRLAYGISSIQDNMDQLSSDLQGVVVYLDDILVSGATADEHLENVR